MNLFIKKIFSLSDIRYSWLIFISMMIFVLSLYNNKINPDITIRGELITYGSAVAIAFAWSILNYIDHIKINVRFKKYDNINTYVENLVMNKQEKEDLKSYLNDFVNDLEANGKTKEEAVKAAIEQFQVQEFTSLSKNSGIFELPVHYYLLGYVIIFGFGMAIVQVLTGTIFDYFLLHTINFMLNLYATGFLGLFFLYKFMNILVSRKW